MTAGLDNQSDKTDTLTPVNREIKCQHFTFEPFETNLHRNCHA